MQQQHSKLCKRLILFFGGLFTAGMGVALNTRPGLGPSPITSLPYVLTFAIPALSLGCITVIVNIIFLLTQIVILGKRFKWFMLLQLPTLLFFGCFIDIGMYLTGFFIPESYFLRLTEEVIGCAVLAYGIILLLAADISLMPGDGLIKVISQEYNIVYGAVKMCFDMGIVASAIIFSLCYFGNITGVREGTLVAAFLVGFIIKKQQNVIQFLKKRIDQTK